MKDDLDMTLPHHDASLGKFEAYDVAPFIREARPGGRSLSTAMCRMTDLDDSFAAVPNLTVTVVLAGRGRYDLDVGAGRSSGSIEPGLVVVSPPETLASCALEGHQECLIVALDHDATASLLDEAAGQAAIDLGPLHVAPIRDPFVDALCRRIWEESQLADEPSRLFAESAHGLLLSALLRRAGKADRTEALGLPPWRIRRLREYVDAHLGEDLTLSDLAATVGLSAAHFARAFRTTTGTSPHRWVMSLRVERAKVLLDALERPLVDIAIECGFASQSHFTDVFRRFTGTSPGRWRAQRRL